MRREDEHLENDTVYVINWEKLNSRDKDTGEFANRLLRETDGQNLVSARGNSKDVNDRH